MTVYYVRKDGNDTTGNGSTETPWLTLKKAIATVTHGDTIKVGNGVYAENDGGTLLLKRVFTSFVTIEPELGASGAVTITTTSGTIGTYVSAPAAYYKFRYITFTTIAGAANAFRINNAADHIAFENCIFTPVDGATATVFAYNASTWNVSNISFTDCTINKPSTGATQVGLYLSFISTGVSSAFVFTRCSINSNANGVVLEGADGITFDSCTINSGDRGIMCSYSPDGLSVTDCIITAVSHGIFCNGATNMTILRGSVSVTGAGNGISLGRDDYPNGLATTALITGTHVNHAKDKTGHSVLLGHGCTDCVIDGLVVEQSYDIALAIKEHTGTEVKNCTLLGGTSTALYFKAAISVNAHHNKLIANAGFGFQLLKGDTGNKNQNWTFQNNTIFADGSAGCLNIGGDLDDLGGGVCDYNTYRPNGTAKFGVVRVDTSVLNLTELRAAWALYGDGSNDSHSSMFNSLTQNRMRVNRMHL